MATVSMGDFKCMMCGHEYQEKVVEGEDVVMAINEAGTNGGRPRRQIHIVNAGELKD